MCIDHETLGQQSAPFLEVLQSVFAVQGTWSRLSLCELHSRFTEQLHVCSHPLNEFHGRRSCVTHHCKGVAFRMRSAYSYGQIAILTLISIAVAKPKSSSRARTKDQSWWSLAMHANGCACKAVVIVQQVAVLALGRRKYTEWSMWWKISGYAQF